MMAAGRAGLGGMASTEASASFGGWLRTVAIGNAPSLTFRSGSSISPTVRGKQNCRSVRLGFAPGTAGAGSRTLSSISR